MLLTWYIGRHGCLSIHVRHDQRLRTCRSVNYKGQPHQATSWWIVLLILSQKGLKEPYDLDEYSQMWFPKAEELAQIAAEAEKAGEKEKASEYYLYASATHVSAMANIDLW
jgi:hypothetical protein